ncbi:hypothetical protein [Aquihabitans sp. McL0605]|uniref:hypothetical protein n=1 Tax=Aquihabitans sp. McL0605 TaxID=3415671 RepID=UPI003CEE9EBB
MADWTTISALATAGGTLVLAVATFSAVRSGNRSARTAERTLLASLRPFLVNGRIDDPAEKIMWVDRHWASVGAGRAIVDVGDGVIWLALPLRNAGNGLAHIHGWHLNVDGQSIGVHADVDDFRRQTRDLYVPSGDTGFWQGALRDDDVEARSELAAIVADQGVFSIDLLYGDAEGGQLIISRFSLLPKGDGWMCSVTKHWNLDRADPR